MSFARTWIVLKTRIFFFVLFFYYFISRSLDANLVDGGSAYIANRIDTVAVNRTCKCIARNSEASPIESIYFDMCAVA